MSPCCQATTIDPKMDGDRPAEAVPTDAAALQAFAGTKIDVLRPIWQQWRGGQAADEEISAYRQLITAAAAQLKDKGVQARCPCNAHHRAMTLFDTV